MLMMVWRELPVASARSSSVKPCARRNCAISWPKRFMLSVGVCSTGSVDVTSATQRVSPRKHSQLKLVKVDKWASQERSTPGDLMRTRSSTNSAARLLPGSATLAISACGKRGSDPSAANPSPAPAIASAMRDANCPVLTKASVNTAPTASIDGRLTKVLGPTGSEIAVTTTPLTTGTLASVHAEGGKTYPAPTGKALLAVKLTVTTDAETDRNGGGGLDRYTKPIMLTVGSMKVTELRGSDLTGAGKGWIRAFPTAQAHTLTIATDGGHKSSISTAENGTTNQVTVFPSGPASPHQWPPSPSVMTMATSLSQTTRPP